MGVQSYFEISIVELFHEPLGIGKEVLVPAIDQSWPVGTRYEGVLTHV